MAVYASNIVSRGPFANSAPSGLPTHTAPAGTFLPGTKVQCGTHRVVIDRYLSEGGFAHVYVVTLPRPVEGNAKAVLKRVAVPDKEHLANMRTEVETMKRLRGHKHIVKYIDSHASQLKGGGYEVFLLMEFCQGGGLIDFMNTRLQNRLTEPEIIKIFTDIAEGVANMHYLKPPLLHRDLKVENVLISTTGSKKLFKLCDFGSSAPPRPPATSAAEARLIEDDIQRHTTLQYRSPEMVDVYRKLPTDEKSDIWALGVFLYKLCYYTTPFEEVGQSAILNAKFKYPGYPRFSDQMKLLIASMLREKPGDRPNIYQVLQKACQLDKRELPLRDIYAHRSQSEGRKDQVLPASPSSSQSRVGATLAPDAAAQVKSSIPEIAPMRRGRPTKPVSHHGSAQPSPSPLRMVDASDPFAALDSNKNAAADELSSKFPTLDEFSLLTDRGNKFAFEPKAGQQPEQAEPGLAGRVTNALADQAFVRSPSLPKVPAKIPLEIAAAGAKPQAVLGKKKSLEKDGQARASLPAPLPQKSAMISTGTSASPPPTTPRLVRDHTLWKVPTHDGVVRRTSDDGPMPRTQPHNHGERKSRLARLLQDDAVNSQGHLDREPRSPTSSRPSLEGGRPSFKDLDMGLTRSRSLNIQQRPASVNMGKGPTHIKDKEIKHITTRDYGANFLSAEPEMVDNAAESDMNIQSDIDFLKAREEEEKERKGHHKRLSSGSRHGKRSSLPHIALSGTKNLLTGRFGDAFKMFEGGHGDGHSRSSSHGHDSEKKHHLLSDQREVLTPIAGSEATDLSDDRRLEDSEDLSPAMRREIEKRQLEAEERRVEQAAAEYRQRVTAGRGGQGGGSGISKASTIQNRVQLLLSENSRPSQKTSAGYAKFSGEPAAQSASDSSRAKAPQPNSKAPMSSPAMTSAMADITPHSAPASSLNLPAQDSRLQRPTAPPKPKVLRTGQGTLSMPAVADPAAAEEALMSPDDWEAKFSRRFPSLSGIEMVETDIDKKGPPTRIREV